MTKTVDWAYHWTHDKLLVTAELAERRSSLTICLKTKDEPCFLEQWITHHARIVGLRNLVIFDNMSTSETVFSIYEKFRPDLLVIQFDGYCDALHQVVRYRELYDALKQSATFFTFLDTDEFLVLVEDDRFCADASIVEFIRSHVDVNWFPATWLHNAFRSESRFRCGSDMSVLVKNLRHGKPVVRSAAIVDGVLLHNFQLFSAIDASRTRTNLFLLHRKNLSPERRIAVLMRRLLLQCLLPGQATAVRNFMSEGDTLETILAKDIDCLPQSMKHEFIELRSLVELPETHVPATDILEPGHMRFCSDGRLEFYGEKEKVLVRSFLADSDALTRSTFARIPGLQGGFEQNGALLKADPNPVPRGPTRVMTKITWRTRDSDVVQIYVGRPGKAEEKLVVESGASGATEVDFILPGRHYQFRMYAGKDKKKLLAVLKVPK
jgi:hypothetical protein